MPKRKMKEVKAQWIHSTNLAEILVTTKEKKVGRDMIANVAKHSIT